MRVPSYRKHSSGQARVTLNGRDHLLGPYGSPESKKAYGRLIAEFSAANQSPTFGKVPGSLLLDEVLLAFVKHSKKYYGEDDGEHYQYILTTRSMADLYGSLPACQFGAVQFRAIREWWLTPPAPKKLKSGKLSNVKGRSRQYINAQMKRTLRIISWAVGEGLIPADNYTQIKCVAPLKRGRCEAGEASKIECVDAKLVEATIPHLTQVLADMVRFQRLTGCRPGEVCKIKPGMVDRSGKVWAIRLEDHKTAYLGKERTIYVGPQAQKILAPYLLRAADSFCFSPAEPERQRRDAKHAARKTKMSCGNIPGSNVARRPRKEPGESWYTQAYGRAIKNACNRAKLKVWAPNQLRHSAATAIRKQFGIEAASVILGHSEIGVTQIYAEQDIAKAIEVASQVG